MGPATATPFFFLLMLAMLAVGGCLVLLRSATAGYIVMIAGMGLFILHRLCVYGFRYFDRRDD